MKKLINELMENFTDFAYNLIHQIFPTESEKEVLKLHKFITKRLGLKVKLMFTDAENLYAVKHHCIQISEDMTDYIWDMVDSVSYPYARLERYYSPIQISYLHELGHAVHLNSLSKEKRSDEFTTYHFFISQIEELQKKGEIDLDECQELYTETHLEVMANTVAVRLGLLIKDYL